jgi:cell division transport system permease protein
MRRPRPFAVVGRALRNLRGAPLPAIVTAVTISVAVFLFAALLWTAVNARAALLGTADDSDHLTIFAARGSSGATFDRLRAEVEAFPEIESTRAVSPAAGLAELRRTLGDAGDAFADVDPAQALPPALIVRLRAAGLEPTSVRALTERLRALAGVESVESAVDWLERAARLEAVGKWVLVGWGVMLALGAFLVVGNAARLAALLRRDEIEVLRLVGASDAFVLAPFAIEGAIVGAAGAVAGLVGIFALHIAFVEGFDGATLFAPFLTEVRFLEPPALLVLAAVGPVLGALGALASAQRFLREVPL